MSSRILHKEYGHYIPSFFTMHVDTNETIKDINTLENNAFSTLVHEYIHFLQDLTTIYGLSNIYRTIQFIKYATNQIYQSTGEFNVPIKLNSNILNGNFVAFDWNLGRIIFGEQKNYSSVVITNIKNVKVPIEEMCGQSSIDVINLDLSVGEKGKEISGKYKFGACCILESMAYILEKRIAGKTLELSDMPYNSATKVAEFIYPEFANDELRVLALCDISLNISNPAKFFVYLLNEWKNTGFLPNNAREIYDDFYTQKIQVKIQDGGSVSSTEVDFIPQFEHTADIARNSLKRLFIPKDPTANDIVTRIMNLQNEWIEAIIASAIKLRKLQKYFILDIAEGGVNNINTAFITIFNEFGLPFCTNNRHEGCFFHPIVKDPTLVPNLFLGACQIYKILSSTKNQIACGLIDHCHWSKDVVKSNVNPDTRCYSPWLRCNDKELCLFAQIWKHWNLTNHTPHIPLF